MFITNYSKWSLEKEWILATTAYLISSYKTQINKHNLSIQLLSDYEHQVCFSYGVWQLKKFMGKEYMGVVRSTFLIAPDGTLSHIWSNVRTKGHAEKVLSKLQQLLAAA